MADQPEDYRTERYVAAIWRAVAKACQDSLMSAQERERAIQVAELVEAQLRLAARLYS